MDICPVGIGYKLRYADNGRILRDLGPVPIEAESDDSLIRCDNESRQSIYDIWRISKPRYPV